MRPSLCLLIALGGVATASTALAKKRCDPCAKANQVRGSGWGLLAIPKARGAALRKVVLADFRRRAGRQRGYRLAHRSCGVWRGRKSCRAQVWAKPLGRASLSSGPVDVFEARYQLEGRKPPHDPGPGRDELWIFAAGSEKPTIVLKTGSPGQSGSNGHALLFVCQPDLCALVWETGIGQLSNHNMRILRIAGRKVRRVARLPKRIAKGIGEDIGAEVQPARCGQQTCVCLKTIAGVDNPDPFLDAGAQRRRRYRLAVTPKGFRSCR